MEKPKLFLNYGEFFIVIALFLSILILRLWLVHSEYREFLSKPFYYTKAIVLQQYNKSRGGREYSVLKLQYENGKSCYTTSYDRQVLQGKRVRVKLYPSDKIRFFDYLGTYYIKTRITLIGDSPLSYKDTLLGRIAEQHTDPQITALYQAIFLATPLPQDLRKEISALGVSHLVALSGFHLTILWGLIYGIFGLLYRPFQQRYFPYRMMLLDMGAMALIVLGYYLWLVGSPPSLLRSYAMALVVWIMLVVGIELVSFALLGFVVVLLLALAPALVVSYGFYFSVAGLFYIYLLLYWGKGSHSLLITLVYIPIGIFLLMLPIVHGVFGVVSPWQLLSPLLSLLFILFYPLSIVLHLVGHGGLLDSQLQALLLLSHSDGEHIVPFWAVAIYILLSLGAMRSKLLFAMTLLSAIGYGFFLFYFG